MGTGERLKIAAEKTPPQTLPTAQVLQSQSRPGVLLLMAWIRADEIFEAVASSGAGLVIAAVGHELPNVPRVRRVAKGEGPERDGVILISETDQRDAIQAHLQPDGWLLSPEGGLAAAAAWKLLSRPGEKAAPGGDDNSIASVLVVDFVSPLSEPAEFARLLGAKLPVKLPARTRVGGIIIPQ
jgi:hypothetical protein